MLNLEDAQPKSITIERKTLSKQRDKYSKDRSPRPLTTNAKKSTQMESPERNTPSMECCCHVDTKVDVHMDAANIPPFQPCRKILKSQNTLQTDKHHTVTYNKYSCTVLIERRRKSFFSLSETTEIKTKLIKFHQLQHYANHPCGDKSTNKDVAEFHSI